MTDTTRPSSARSDMPHRANGPNFQANPHQTNDPGTGAAALLPIRASQAQQQTPARKPSTQRAGFRTATDGTLDPAIHDTLQSAMGIVRETTGLLCNITELGLALLWSPKASRQNRGRGRASPPLRHNGTIIPFALASKHRASGRD